MIQRETLDLSEKRRIKAIDARRTRYAGISAMTMWRWQRDRGFPKGIRFGRDTLFDVEDLDAWDARVAAEKAALAEAAE